MLICLCGSACAGGYCHHGTHFKHMQSFILLQVLDLANIPILHIQKCRSMDVGKGAMLFLVVVLLHLYFFFFFR